MERSNFGRYVSLLALDHARFDLIRAEVDQVVREYRRDFGREPQVVQIRALSVLPSEPVASTEPTARAAFEAGWRYGCDHMEPPMGPGGYYRNTAEAYRDWLGNRR